MSSTLPVHAAAQTLTVLPRQVAWLGYGGLLPFVGLALLAVTDAAHASLWQRALVGYGAVILSFVGALHWGVAMCASALDGAARQRAFAWSVVPALLAWPAALMGGALGAVLLAAGFIAHWLRDRRLAGQAGLPEGYRPMRARLTAVACAALLLGGLGGPWVG